ncbi:MAG TPA: cobalamin-dependent protein [Bryobacteraceae bacterium]|nr:cobalamin-dependent protein [Bryobacteraceae bacterium]
MRKVYIVALHQIPFLPYLHGLLRCAVESDAGLASYYSFAEPVFLSEPSQDIVDRMDKPDVVGFSCYVWNFRRHMKIAELVRRRFPECLVVAGGPHIPDRSAHFFERYPFVDLLIHGEGEHQFVEVLRERLLEKPNWSGIEGISFAAGGHSVKIESDGAPAQRHIQLDSPYLRGYLQNSIDLCHERDVRFYALWETNRGCPYSCTFCDWGSATMSKIRMFPDAQIYSDIEYFGRQHVPNVFICDANFGILPRDVEIARRFAAARVRYGYPQQIRVNFAKESNDRVFEISKIFADREMLMGTTLSMQSMDMDVLAAVERKNIGYQNFQKLSHRYRSSGIHTYSELILGLPRETRRGFEDGIGSLLDGGNHEDIRVFDFMILPNSPVNNPASFNEFGLKTIQRKLYLDVPGQENEFAEFVIETNTLSREDWVSCQLFSQAVQFLHNGCFTRYLAIHLRRAYGFAFAEFYRRLVRFACERPETVLGSVLQPLERMYREALHDNSVPYVHMVASNPQMVERVRVFGNRKGWTPDQWAWLCVSAEHDRFYRELDEFVHTLPLALGSDMPELLRYQDDVVLQLDYDPLVGKRRHYKFDFPAYFTGDQELCARPLWIHFRDTAMGVNRQYPLEKGNPRRFAKAAVGESYPLVRIRHFQHQAGEATITYELPAAPAQEAYAARP